MNDKVFVVSYYDEGEPPVVTVFDNEEAALFMYNWVCRVGGHSKVDMDECPVYSTFTINGNEVR